jgi:predicted DNA-binding WGR domain protein
MPFIAAPRVFTNTISSRDALYVLRVRYENGRHYVEARYGRNDGRALRAAVREHWYESEAYDDYYRLLRQKRDKGYVEADPLLACCVLMREQLPVPAALLVAL